MLQMDTNDLDYKPLRDKKVVPFNWFYQNFNVFIYLFSSITADQSKVCSISILCITNFYLSLKPILIVIYVLSSGLV